MPMIIYRIVIRDYMIKYHKSNKYLNGINNIYQSFGYNRKGFGVI